MILDRGVPPDAVNRQKQVLDLPFLLQRSRSKISPFFLPLITYLSSRLRFDQACSVEVRDCGHQMCASCALALCCHSKPSPTTLALPSPACPFCRGSISRLPVASGPRASSRGGGPSGGRATSAARASRGCRRPWGPSRSRSSGPAGPWTATVATSTSLSMIRDSGIRFINAGGVRPRGW
jgi:hypothetical protein